MYCVHSHFYFTLPRVIVSSEVLVMACSINSLKKFSVVLFNDENRYAVVPSSWIRLDSSQCYWPGRKTKNPATLATDENSIPDKTFGLHGAQFIKSYG